MAGGVLESGSGEFQPLAEINVTPFVDVMLVLLIVFMVTAPLMMSGVELQLPKTSAAPLDKPQKPVIVSITADGALHLGDETLDDPAMKAKLAAVHGERADAIVYVRGDRSVPYGRIMEAITLVNEAGFAQVSLIAQSMPPEAAVAR
ncbi:MAG TPA: ExbD/TolR family protein [Dongiaceae bacterium]|jgi:biopolymer transport protein TolR